MSWYEVYSVVAGAQDTTLEPLGGHEVDSFAADLAYRLSMELGAGTWNDEPWEVYILPHSCDRASGSECDCAQYVTDHHPVHSSESYSRQSVGVVHVDWDAMYRSAGSGEV